MTGTRVHRFSHPTFQWHLSWTQWIFGIHWEFVQGHLFFWFIHVGPLSVGQYRLAHLED